MDVLHEDLYIFLIKSLWILRMRNILDKGNRENQITHSIFSNFICWKLCCLWDNVEKYCRAVRAIDDNMVPVNCMLDTSGYRYTLRICNTHWFSTPTMISQTCLIVMLYIHCLPYCSVRQKMRLEKGSAPKEHL